MTRRRRALNFSKHEMVIGKTQVLQAVDAPVLSRRHLSDQVAGEIQVVEGSQLADRPGNLCQFVVVEVQADKGPAPVAMHVGNFRNIVD